MNTKIKLVAGLALSAWFVLGCSSSNDAAMPAPVHSATTGPTGADNADGTIADDATDDSGTADAGTGADAADNSDSTDPGTADAETTDAEMVDAGSADANETDADVSDAVPTGGSGEIDLNGDYIVVAPLDSVSLAVPECTPAEGTFTVEGRTISGVVNDVLTVTGTINADGTISGGFAFDGGSKAADYTGMVVGADLEGTWTDQFGCSGTWRASKVYN